MGHPDQLGLIDPGEPYYDEALSQWYTPPDLAQRIVAWALRGTEGSLRILEPSAGDGALIRPLSAIHRATAYEIDLRRMAVLSCLDQVEEVRPVGYLGHWSGDHWDLAIMNPPYENGAAERFVRKAVTECDRVVALLRASALFGVERWGILWSQVAITRLALLTRRPQFGGAQSQSPAGDYVVVECRRRREEARLTEASRVEVEWW